MILDAQGRSIRELKPKHKWDKVDNEGSEANDMAVFSIFNEVCLYEFCKIANYKRAKEAWDILLVTREGTSVVKISKLQMFATKFENIIIHENQNSSFFYFELSDILLITLLTLENLFQIQR